MHPVQKVVKSRSDINDGKDSTGGGLPTTFYGSCLTILSGYSACFNELVVNIEKSFFTAAQTEKKW